MRKLRLLLFITCGVISIFETFAQTFAIKTGVNLSTMLTKDDRSKYSSDYTLTPGLLFGVATELPINQKFSFETGLLFSSKGFQLNSEYKIYETSEPIKLFHNTILNYIDIPLSLKTSTSFFRLPIYGRIGPYIGVGLNGKIIGDEYSGTVTERKEFKFRIVSEGDWKRFDYGLQLSAGILIGKFDFGLNYAYGLANITKQSTLVKKNRIIGLTVGYKFKTKE
jgi:hypothetical protein